MKLEMNLMPQIRERAAAMVNNYLASQADPHRDQAHRLKRDIATSVLNGGAATAEFAEEARLRGLSVQTFATLIASKPDLVAQRELTRQKTLLAMQVASTPAMVQELLDTLKKQLSAAGL
jgi:hypothetical protein